MGASASKSDVLNQVLNKTAIDIMTKNSMSSSGYIKSSNDLTIAGNTGGSISGISQINAAAINVKALLGSSQGADMRSALTAALTAAVKQEARSIGYTADEANVKSVVENNVNVNMTSENLLTIKNEVLQDNKLQIIANTGTDVSAIIQKNEATLIAELVSNMNASIVNSLTTSGTVTADLSQTTASFIPSFGAIIIIIALVVCGGLYFFKDSLGMTLTNVTKPAPMILIGCVLVFLFIIAK